MRKGLYLVLTFSLGFLTGAVLLASTVWREPRVAVCSKAVGRLSGVVVGLTVRPPLKGTPLADTAQQMLTEIIEEYRVQLETQK